MAGLKARRHYEEHSVQPIRRDVKFDFPADRIGDWHGDGHAVTAFINALSVVFPEGERFFIDSVRHYRDQIQDPELLEAVKGFIGQEAMHGREHERWNENYFAKVPAARKIYDFTNRRLKRWQKWLPKSTQLSMTIGAEHLTAILSDYILRHPEFLTGHGETRSDLVHVEMLRWHALEETEHKAVAFDVWKTVMRKSPRAYAERMFGLAFMFAAYWPVIGQLIAEGLRAQGLDATQAKSELANLRSILYGKEGLFRGIGLPLLGYMKPGFHPWDDDNRELLDEMASIEANYAVA